MKRHLVLISVGFLNLLHGAFHIIQFIQSILLATYSTHHHEHSEGWVDSLLHNPWMAIFWAIIGILTMVIGVRDYRHHKRCGK